MIDAPCFFFYHGIMEDLKPYLQFAWYCVRVNKFTVAAYLLIAIVILILDIAK